MTTPALEKELDPSPLVARITDKSKVGKLRWQPTADEDTFVVSLGGDTTLKMTLESVEEFDGFSGPTVQKAPVLTMLDPKGKTLWEIHSSQVKGGLWPLYRLAQRIANKLDERMMSLMEALENLGPSWPQSM